MKRQFERRPYVRPETQEIRMEHAVSLMDTSYPGQHHPAHHGSGPSSAKQGTFWDDEDENESDESDGTTPQPLYSVWSD